MELSSPTPLSLSFLFLFSFSFYVSLFPLSHSQQTYINNKQVDCNNYNNLSFTNGYLCNGTQTSCVSYLTFRSQPPFYDSAVAIGNLLGSNPSSIAQINNIANIEKIPVGTKIIVPVSCSCTGNFYEFSTSYILQAETETYFTVANNTYQGLTTCQALMNQNPYDGRNLSVGSKLLVPLRCACPTKNQLGKGVKFLLAYSITYGDTISSIGDTFGVDEQSIYDANELFPSDLIFPFTFLLIPLKNEPKIQDPIDPFLFYFSCY